MVEDSTTKDKSAKDKSAKDKSAKDTTAKDSTANDTTAKDTTAKDKSAKDKSAKDKSAKGRSAIDEALKDYVNVESCTCIDEQPQDKSMCYIEGSRRDKNESLSFGNLSDNVWFGTKPPKLLGTQSTPLISARQLQIVRAKLSGKMTGKCEQMGEEAAPKVSVGVNKKKSAVRFLSSTKIQNID